MQYKNSFQEIAFREEKRKKNYFFKSNADLSMGKEDRVREDGEGKEEGEEEREDEEMFVRLPRDRCVNT